MREPSAYPERGAIPGGLIDYPVSWEWWRYHYESGHTPNPPPGYYEPDAETTGIFQKLTQIVEDRARPSEALKNELKQIHEVNRKLRQDNERLYRLIGKRTENKEATGQKSETKPLWETE